MRTRIAVMGLVLTGLLAASAGAARPEPPPEALAMVPDKAVAFFHMPSISQFERDLKHFADMTGWNIGKSDQPVIDLLGRRTGIHAGLDPDGSACIAFMDPKRFRDRYTIYVLPVKDWDGLLKATAGEEMAPDLYALTGTTGPRFVLRRGRFALVTSSVRTMDAIVSAGRLPGVLSAATLDRARAGAPMVYVNVRRLRTSYEADIASWFRAASGQIYHQAQAVAYADMLVTYMFGIAGILDQLETVEAGLRLEPEGLAIDLSLRFTEGRGVADFFSKQVDAAAPIPGLTDRPLASGVTICVNDETRTGFILKATQFFLESAPRPEPLPESTKESVYEAVQTFAESLGEHMTFLSAPAAPGMGVASDVTIFDLKDPEKFQHGVDLMASAWEQLADQLDLYLEFKASPKLAEVAGVPITSYLPRLRFGLPARHVEFRKRLRSLYGPEGLIYRVAVVGNYGVVCTGSDLDLFHKTIERLKENKPAGPTPALQRLENHVSRDQNILMAVNLPLYLGQSLRRGGTPEDRIGTIDPGHELVGIGVRMRGAVATVTSYWAHEQIRLARELIGRAAPGLAEVPESLFEPPPEGPPTPGPVVPAPVEPPVEPEAPAPAP